MNAAMLPPFQRVSQYISNLTLLTYAAVQGELSEAQSLVGYTTQLLLASGLEDVVAWGELVIVVPAEQA